MHIGVEQQIQGQGLMDIERSQPPGFLVHQAFTAVVLQTNVVVCYVNYLGNETLVIEQKFVEINLFGELLAIQCVDGFAIELHGLHVIDPIPEAAFVMNVAFGQQTNIAHQLIAVIVLGLNAAAPCLEAHIDVFCYQHQLSFRMSSLVLADVVNYFVVVIAAW